MISIIDYGVGNIGSIINMINRVGGNCKVVNSFSEILEADKLILPGVGSFDHGIRKLQEYNLIDAIEIFVKKNQRPLLGICLGAQLLTKKSEEGVLPGFGFFDSEVLHFNKLYNIDKIRIPHMGWNNIELVSQNNLLNNLPENSRFYFVHSYFIKSNNQSEVLCYSNYNSKFVSGLFKDNIWALQFHPEKSHKYGMSVFQNFLKL